MIFVTVYLGVGIFMETVMHISSPAVYACVYGLWGFVFGIALDLEG